jgi:hypothetical protein
MSKIDNDSWDGQELKEMFATATRWLEKNAPSIDALNVFPVPDGDTGINMLLTMRSTMEEAERTSSSSASEVSKAMAHGALLGARGNSGVILSQILQGVAWGLEGKDSFSGADFAAALKLSATAAYNGMSNPVEGTILTVIRDASSAAHKVALTNGSNLKAIMESTAGEAKESVARTPSLLSVLREAGVVDAGGQGLYVLFDGILCHLRGEIEELEYRKPEVITGHLPATALAPRLSVDGGKVYGYCTQFILEGRKLNLDKIRRRLESKGDSLIVVGDEKMVKVHIHSTNPGAILHYATSKGTLHQIHIQNMDDQHEDFLELTKAEPLGVATVAVVSGDGFAEVFRSLGVTAIVPGGQTMNPSTREILRAVESTLSDKVIILPNNSNIVLTANQVQSLTNKEVEVVPTETMPQGIASLLSFNYDADLEGNTSAMEEARKRVRTMEVTRAVRSSEIGGTKIKKGEVIAILDGELAAVGNNVSVVFLSTIFNMDMSESEMLTIYYGAETEKADAEAMAEEVRHKYPHLEVELIQGGQPHYNYIVSIE